MSSPFFFVINRNFYTFYNEVDQTICISKEDLTMKQFIERIMSKPANELSAGDSFVYTILLMLVLTPICLLPVFIQWVADKISDWRYSHRKED